MTPYYADDAVTLYHGDCLLMLTDLDEASIDAVVTDPPYSSGGAMRSDRMSSTVAKYVSSTTKAVTHEFSGDNRDQRSYLAWTSLWMAPPSARHRRNGIPSIMPSIPRR